jgi:hypothetical protein
MGVGFPVDAHVCAFATAAAGIRAVYRRWDQRRAGRVAVSLRPLGVGYETGRRMPLTGAGLPGLAEEQAALRRVATLVASGTPPEDVFATVTECR